MIDVLWIKDNEVTHAFEIENTTGFIAAIARGSNLPAQAKRFMVLPEERIDDLARKLSDPSVAHDYERYGWRKIFYNRLEDFCERPKSKGASTEHALDRIMESPMPAKFGAPATGRARRTRKVPAEQLRMDSDDEPLRGVGDS
jgi:hypothetical protein